MCFLIKNSIKEIDIMKKRILSSYVLALSFGTVINAWSALPEYNALKSIQTFDVGSDPSASDIMIINHNEDKLVLLVKKDHSAFAVADLSIDISEEEAISHLNSQYLTGSNVGFLDNYPNPPENLSSYTELGFDADSTQSGFKMYGQRIILEAKAYLSTNNLVIPWQEGYAAYNLADGFVSVDDTDDSYVDGFYRCPLTAWADDTNVIEQCIKIPGLDFHDLTSSASQYIGMTASDKALVQGDGYLWNMANGKYVTGLDHFSYIHQPITIEHEDNQASSPKTIKFYQDDTLEVIVHEGVFVPTVELGFAPILLAVLEGNRAAFVVEDGGDGIVNSCKLEFGAFDFTPKELDLTINGMLQEYLSQEPSLAIVLGNYPDKPTDINAANEILGDGPGSEPLLVITESMTDEEFKIAIDDLWLTAEYTNWVENAESNYLARLAEFSEKYPDQYYHCVEEIRNEKQHLLIAKLGSFITSDGYVFGSSGLKVAAGLNALSTFAYSEDGGYQLVSDSVFNLLTSHIPDLEIEQIIADIKIEFTDDYGGFPVLPDHLSNDELFYRGGMNMLILKKLGYNGELGLASVSADSSSILLGRAGTNGSWVSGRGSNQSYLIYNEQPRNIVRILPNTTTIDPYVNAALTTRIELETENLYGAELRCQFDEDSLYYQDSNYSNFFNTPFKFELPISNTRSEWFGATALFGAAEAVTGIGDFSEIHHQAALTTANVTLTCNAIFSDSEGNSMSVVSEEIVVTIDDGIHGITGESGEIRGSIDLPVSINGQPVEVSVSINGRTISASSIDGEFIFENLRDGSFTMTVKTDNHVAACTTVEIIDGAAVSIETIELVSGDVNGDGIIDIGDYTLLSASYGLSAGDEGYSEVLDLNLDGLINIQDVSILGSHFNAVSCIQ